MARRSLTLFLACSLLLTVLGFVMQMSTGGFSNGAGSDEWFTVRKQAHSLMLGLVLGSFLAWKDYRWLLRWAMPIFAISIILLVLCYVPGVRQRINESSRWIQIGGLQFQPSEFARIGIVIAIAAWCVRPQNGERPFVRSFLLPILISVPGIALIAGEVDIGGAILLTLGCGAVIYASGAKLWYLLMAGLLAAVLFSQFVWSIPNRRARIDAFLSLDKKRPEGKMSELEKQRWDLGGQQRKGLIAAGSGGLTGTGLGDGRQKQYRLELPNTDFIFPVIGEELGIFGTLGTVILFLSLGLSGIFLACQAPDRFGRLVGIGLMTMIMAQALINMGVTVGLLPNKGMPLPFVSYGGTNLIGMYLIIGFFINLYRHRTPRLPQSREAFLGQRKLTPAV
jgi:cell division protein FtsW